MVEVLPKAVAADPDTLAGFEREMSSARGQAHPSTCRSGSESRAIWRLQEEKIDYLRREPCEARSGGASVTTVSSIPRRRRTR